MKHISEGLNTDTLVLYQSKYLRQQSCALCVSMVGDLMSIVTQRVSCVCACTGHCERMSVRLCFGVCECELSLSDWGLDFFHYALHDIAVMICTLMSIY